MRLLISGASGFIGRNILLAVPETWEVIALHRSSKNDDFYHFLQTHHLRHVQAIACDLTDEYQVKQAIKRIDTNFDSFLALASNTSIPASIQQPAMDLITNTIGLLYILDQCRFDHLIYLSSGAVYIGLDGLVGPQSALNPTLPYAISKLAAEQYITAYWLHQHTFRSATILRFFGAYGPYEPSRKLYTKLVRQFAFDRNPYFTITGDGENYIDAMYIDDAVKALMAVLTHTSKDGVRCLDLGVGSRESINQVVTYAAHTFGLEPELQHVGSSPEYIRFVIDPAPFNLAYQFTSTIPLAVGLQLLAKQLIKEDGR